MSLNLIKCKIDNLYLILKEYALAFTFTINEISFVPFPVWPFVHALSVSEAIFHKTYVFAPVSPYKCAESGFFAIS